MSVQGAEHKKGERFRCLKTDAARLRFADDNSADAVVIMWALHEMQDPVAVLTEARRVLRAGGELLIVDFPRDSLAQRLWNEDYYRPDDAKRLLVQVGLSHVSVRLIEKDQVLWAHGRQPVQEKEQR